MTREGFSQPKQGWQCPLCKTIYSPSMVTCTCQKVQKSETRPTADVKPNIKEGLNPCYPWTPNIPAYHIYPGERCPRYPYDKIRM